jgi:hypothetical protein
LLNWITKQFGHGVKSGFPLLFPLFRIKKCGFEISSFGLKDFK